MRMEKRMNKRGDLEVEYPIELIIAGIIILIIVVGVFFYNFLPKGVGIIEHLTRLVRGG